MAAIVSRSTQSAQSSRPRGPSVGAIIRMILRYALLIILALLFLLPFYLIVRNGLAAESEITSPNWTFFPSTLHFENIQELFKDTEVPFLDGMVNS
ncbi:MAG: carbohydrate ABC transporter permease, partial [Chloroflexi bacterium]